MSYHRSDDGSFKFFIGLVLGLIGGAVAAAMFATKPGSELRRDIENGSEELVHNLKERLEDVKEKANEHFKDFKGFTDDRFRTSALNIQDKVTDLGKQLDELTKKRGDFADSSKS